LKIDPSDLRDLKLFKYYRLVRKWACKTNNLTDADLELLIFFDCLGRFTRNDYKDGVYLLHWDKDRWERLRREGWISVWRERNRTTQKYAIYQTSTKAKLLITRIYKMLLGEEDIPTSNKSIFWKNKTYTDKVFNHAINLMINDKNR